MKKIFIVFLLCGALGMANSTSDLKYEENYVITAECVEDDLKGTFTGKSKTSSSGKLLYQYRCPNGHKWYAKPE